MLPHEILPAIPRQKVKYVDNHGERPRGLIGQVAEVLCENGPSVWVRCVPSGTVLQWSMSHCEPVPEEPRPFRVNDAVIVNGNRATKITGVIFRDEQMYLLADSCHSYFAKELRHATPEELAKYF